MTIADSPSLEAKDLLALRYDARRWLWKNGGLQRVRNCGRVAVSGGLGLMRYPDGAVITSGAQHCSSVWACPVCSARILQLRSERLSAIVQRWRDRGGAVAMVTLTMSHDRADSLDDLWDDVQSSWTASIATGSWRRAQNDYGRVIDSSARRRIPVVRVIETTWGPSSGWHVHIHALLFLAEADRAATALAEIWEGDETRRVVGLRQRWQNQARKRGRFAAPEAQEAHVVVDDSQTAVAGYLAKAVLDGDISKEIMRGDLKYAHGQRFTPWQLLSLVAQGEHPEKEQLVRGLWHEWEAASHGRRQMSISRSLADFLKLKPISADDVQDFDDSDPAAESWTPQMKPALTDKQQDTYWRPAGPPEWIGVIPARIWKDVLCANGLDASLTQAASNGALDLLMVGQQVRVVPVSTVYESLIRDSPYVGETVVLSEKYVMVKP